MAGKNGLPLHADDLRALGKDLPELLSQIGPKKADELRYNAKFWARPEQIPAEGDWDTFLALAGRGWGKTWAGAQWCREQVKQGKRRIMAIAATNSDIERVMVKGESGFLAVCWANDKTHKGVHMGAPEWSPTKRTITWANGATVTFFSSEEPDRLRGPQGDACWMDELCAWNKDRETYDMAQFCLRLGKHPRTFITTTPKPTKLLREIIKNPRTQVVRGSTFDNSANLAESYLNVVKSQYEGTRLGRQELYAEIMDEASGALWTREILSKCEFECPDPVVFANENLVRVVVAIDPAVTANAESDMTGIVVAGVNVNGKGYVLEDATGKYSPQQWASKAIELYDKYEADRVVCEVNQGGDLVKHTLTTERDNLPIRMVRASKSKKARAEPISALYEQGKVFHVRGLDALEDQMVQYEPLGSMGSPDRLDAMVWALTDLMLGGVIKPNLNLAYSDAKGLLQNG